MPYITSVERIAIEKGRKEAHKLARLESIEDLLRVKFGEAGLALLPEIKALDDAE